MVDKLLSIDNESVISSFAIVPECIFVHNGRLTETGLLENAAQTSSAILGRNYFDEDDIIGNKDKLIGYISAVKSFKVLGLPSIGQEIITSSTIISKFVTDTYSISTIGCEIKSNNYRLADCVLNLIIQKL